MLTAFSQFGAGSANVCLMFAPIGPELTKSGATSTEFVIGQVWLGLDERSRPDLGRFHPNS